MRVMPIGKRWESQTKIMSISMYFGHCWFGEMMSTRPRRSISFLSTVCQLHDSNCKTFLRTNFSLYYIRLCQLLLYILCIYWNVLHISNIFNNFQSNSFMSWHPGHNSRILLSAHVTGPTHCKSSTFIRGTVFCLLRYCYMPSIFYLNQI